MTSWVNEGLEDRALCGSDMKVVNQLLYVNRITCLFCLNTFRNTCTWVFLKWLIYYFYLSSFLVSTLYFTSSSFFASNETFTWLLFSSTFYSFTPLVETKLKIKSLQNFQLKKRLVDMWHGNSGGCTVTARFCIVEDWIPQFQVQAQMRKLLVRRKGWRTL